MLAYLRLILAFILFAGTSAGRVMAITDGDTFNAPGRLEDAA